MTTLNTDHIKLAAQTRLLGKVVHYDVLVNDKKIGGVLAELHTSEQRVEALILGIGVNVNISCNARVLRRGAPQNVSRLCLISMFSAMSD
jgi:hypothetical protein